MNNNSDNKEEIQDAFGYTTYLIGSMEKCAEGDDGSEKRAGVAKELLLRDVFPINPVKLERSKVDMETEELKEKMSGWIASGNWELFREYAEKIWKGIDGIDQHDNLYHIPGDIDYVKQSDWITFTLNKGDVPCGSYAECGIAMEHMKPIYLITNVSKKELPKSLLQMICVTHGEVFNTLNHYLEYIDKTYDLKRKEEKK
jgi:hypothetical protein